MRCTRGGRRRIACARPLCTRTSATRRQVFPPRQEPPPALESAEESIAALRSRHRELDGSLEGDVDDVNRTLESRVLHLQEDFVALQGSFKDMRDVFGHRIASLTRVLESEQEVALTAGQRAICKEDLVRFHGEQRRMMAGHWRSQCQAKDKEIHALNLQLTQYMVDWQQPLGKHRQTEQRRSHELQCLQDRYQELLCEGSRQQEQQEQTQQTLSESRADAQTLSEAEERVENSRLTSLGSRRATLLAQLQFLEKRKSLTLTQPAFQHSCIWRDELAVREQQIAKIQFQSDRTGAAISDTQAELFLRRSRYEELRQEQRDAEVELRACEDRRTRWERIVTNVHRAQDLSRRALAENFVSNPASPTGSSAGSPMETH